MATDSAWVEYFILGVIALSALIGLLRGLLKEAISLGTWIAAFIVAALFVRDGAAYLAKYIGIPSVSIILAFGLLYLSVLIIGGLINLVVAQLIEPAGLSGVDRVLGLVFGLLRGMLLITVLVLMAGFTPLPQDAWWKQSPLLPRFQQGAVWLRDRLPADIAEHIKFP